MTHNTNQTITIELEPVRWPAVCQRISHPHTKYTVYYGRAPCGTGGEGCMSEVRGKFIALI